MGFKRVKTAASAKYHVLTHLTIVNQVTTKKVMKTNIGSSHMERWWALSCLRIKVRIRPNNRKDARAASRGANTHDRNCRHTCAQP